MRGTKVGNVDDETTADMLPFVDYNGNYDSGHLRSCPMNELYVQVMVIQAATMHEYLLGSWMQDSRIGKRNPPLERPHPETFACRYLGCCSLK